MLGEDHRAGRYSKTVLGQSENHSEKYREILQDGAGRGRATVQEDMARLCWVAVTIEQGDMAKLCWRRIMEKRDLGR